MPTTEAPAQEDPKIREALEKELAEGDALLKQYRWVLRSPESASASGLLTEVTARYRGVLSAISSTADIPQLRQRAWFGLGRASVLAGALLEADER